MLKPSKIEDLFIPMPAKGERYHMVDVGDDEVAIPYYTPCADGITPEEAISKLRSTLREDMVNTLVASASPHERKIFAKSMCNLQEKVVNYFGHDDVLVIYEEDVHKLGGVSHAFLGIDLRKINCILPIKYQQNVYQNDYGGWTAKMELGMSCLSSRPIIWCGLGEKEDIIPPHNENIQ